MENVEVGAVRGLDGDHKALLVRSTLPSRRLIPDREVFEVFIGHVGVLCVGRIRENLLL